MHVWTIHGDKAKSAVEFCTTTLQGPISLPSKALSTSPWVRFLFGTTSNEIDAGCALGCLQGAPDRLNGFGVGVLS